jgi:hypothetical protein
MTLVDQIQLQLENSPISLANCRAQENEDSKREERNQRVTFSSTRILHVQVYREE